MDFARSISLDKCALGAAERSRIDGEVGRLERRAGKFPDPKFHAALVPLARGRGFEASLSLKVAGRTIAARERAGRPVAAFEAAARKIARQLEGYKGRLRHESSFGRAADLKRRPLRGEERAAELPAPFRDVDAFREEVLRRLPELREAARRHCRLDIRTRKLVPRLIEIEDVVDEAIVEALGRLAERPARSELLEWFDGILEAVTGEVATRFADSAAATRASRSAGGDDGRITTPVEFLDAIELIEHGDWPESSREVAAPRKRPESVPERVEFRRNVASALRKLPRSWRKALALRYFDGLKPSEIAAEQSVPESAVAWRLRAALRFLHENVPEDVGTD